MPDNSPFRKVVADYDVSGDVQVMWSMDPGFSPTPPLTFTLQWARDGSDDWVDVDTVEDSFTTTDTTTRRTGALREGYYRVVLEDGEGEIYESPQSNYHLGWSIRDINLAKEIRRREEKMYEAAGASEFYILFRKHWGAECSSCVNPTTGESRSPRCSECYGTGIDGGYWTGHKTLGITQGSGQEISQQLGTIVQEQSQVRMSPVPIPTKFDIIVKPEVDYRYEVVKVKQEASWKSRPLVISLQLDKIDPSDVIYDVPIE